MLYTAREMFIIDLQNVWLTPVYDIFVTCHVTHSIMSE
jgi:cytochrome c oxidase assembly factor CtaG